MYTHIYSDQVRKIQSSTNVWLIIKKVQSAQNKNLSVES